MNKCSMQKKIESLSLTKDAVRNRLKSELASVISDFHKYIGIHTGGGTYTGDVAYYILDGEPSKDKAFEDIDYVIGRLEDLKQLINTH